MTYAGARGKTAEQMRGTLHLTLKDEALHAAFAGLIGRLNSPAKDFREKPAYELVISNALWGQQGYAFKKEFTQLLEKGYGAPLREVNYKTDAEGARRNINAWVEKQTKEKIKDLIPPGVLNEMTRLVLTNAIYFKSNWARKFEKAATKDGPFHLAGGKDVTTPMMHQRGRFAYLETDTFQALELQYIMRELAMIIVLPKKTANLRDVEKAFLAEEFVKWAARMDTKEVRVTLPKFKFTSQFRLKGTLEALGMADAFKPDVADFSGMTAAEKLFIAEAIHKAFVAVDEEGTEAAAATAVIMSATAMPQPVEPKVFTADHPFMFLIRHRATGSILFMGRLSNPKE